MRIGLIALSGVRVRTAELAALGVTLPGFVRRGRVIASLPSLGLLTVAGLTPPGHEITYLEVDDLASMVTLPEFDLVGISSFTARIDAAYALAGRFRARGVPVVLGGLHVSLVPAEALGHADAIVVGGAEGAWPRLVTDAERDRLARVYEGARERVFEPGLYATPRFDLLQGRAYNRITVQTSRGCPRACEFCAASLRITTRFNPKPVDRVIAEIRAARRHVAEPFFELADDNSFANRFWAKEFLTSIQDLDLRWFTETDLSIADDDELLKLLARSGCRQILIGLESTDAHTLDGIDRANWKLKHLSRYMDAIKKIQSHGVTVNGCFIVGNDGDDKGVFERLRNFIEKSELLEAQVTILTPFPGTQLLARLQRERRLLSDRIWDKCTLFDLTFHPKQMTPDELVEGHTWLMSQIYNQEQFTRRKRHYVNIMKEISLPWMAEQTEASLEFFR